MKTQNKIHSFFNRDKISILPENTYTPSKLINIKNKHENKKV